MRNRLLKFIVLLGLISASTVLIDDSIFAIYADDVNCDSNGSECFQIGTISVDDLYSDSNLIKRLQTYAALDDVDKNTSCDTLVGVKDALVGGFEAISKDRGGGGATNKQKMAMLYNTWYLQRKIACMSEEAEKNNRQGIIVLPEGVYYFVSGHTKLANDSPADVALERHVIKLYDNITLKGMGTTDDNNTTLKPYSEKIEFKDIGGGLDMFFFNNYRAYNFQRTDHDTIYLENVHFSDFVIDSAETSGKVYNTSGKGFMINLFENGTWDNVVVKNTDGTGFGVDCPIGNSYIKNSKAIGNGKGVFDKAKNVVLSSGGGSGFGIGTGYSDNEKFVIKDSEAEGNGLYGFFYEHQGRFAPNHYLATKGNFLIINNKARANTWNYGGLRAYDTMLASANSITGTYINNGGKIETIRNVHFSDESRNIEFINLGVFATNSAYDDIEKNNGEFYYDAVLWGEARGLTGDAIDSPSVIVANADMKDNYASSRKYGVKDNDFVSRAEAITMLWRMMGMPGDTISVKNGNVVADRAKVINIETPFCDVPSNRAYASAVAWAYKNGITNGMGGSCNNGLSGTRFGPNENLTRAQFVTLLWRLNGSTTEDTSANFEEFSDVKDKDSWYYDAVKWATNNSITNGVGNNKFAPDIAIKRREMIALLYRYWVRFDGQVCRWGGCEDYFNFLLDYHHNNKRMNSPVQMTSFGEKSFIMGKIANRLNAWQ